MDVLVLLNQKGGAAKTTTAANFAAVLGRQGKRCLLVDLDVQASLTTNLLVRTRWNVFERGVVTVDTRLPNVDLVPGGPELITQEMGFTRDQSYDELRPLLAQVAHYDYVLVDCPPNLYGLTANALVAADRIILPFPLTPGVIMSMKATFDLIKELREAGYPVTERIDGLITIYRKAASAEKLVPRAEKFVPNVLAARIRLSNHYIRAEGLGTAAALLGTEKSFPLIDHRRALQEMGLL